MIGQVSSTKEHGKATWRGEIKIQRQLGVPARQALFFVCNEDFTVWDTMKSSKALRVLMNSRVRAFFKATLRADGTLDIRQGVPDRRW